MSMSGTSCRIRPGELTMEVEWAQVLLGAIGGGGIVGLVT